MKKWKRSEEPCEEKSDILKEKNGNKKIHEIEVQIFLEWFKGKFEYTDERINKSEDETVERAWNDEMDKEGIGSEQRAEVWRLRQSNTPTEEGCSCLTKEQRTTGLLLCEERLQRFYKATTAVIFIFIFFFSTRLRRPKPSKQLWVWSPTPLQLCLVLPRLWFDWHILKVVINLWFGTHYV